MNNRDVTILIVEDEIALREAYEIILRGQGYEVISSQNGIDGLVMLKKHRPRIALVDIFMPLMDGKELLLNIDKNEYPDTKIVMMTNLSDKKIKQEVLATGADKYIIKSSMGVSELLKLVKNLLAQS
jgi:DNA-binding response OmpR family regulator